MALFVSHRLHQLIIQQWRRLFNTVCGQKAFEITSTTLGQIEYISITSVGLVFLSTFNAPPISFFSLLFISQL
jgi:hypothetical protein